MIFETNARNKYIIKLMHKSSLNYLGDYLRRVSKNMSAKVPLISKVLFTM